MKGNRCVRRTVVAALAGLLVLSVSVSVSCAAPLADGSQVATVAASDARATTAPPSSSSWDALVGKLQSVDGGATSGGRGGGAGGTYGLYAIVALTVLSLAPAILVMVTSFTRIIIVLHFLRQALGMQNVPPNQVLMGLAIFLTYFSMGGVLGEMHDVALSPYLAGTMTVTDALGRAEVPLRNHLLHFTRESDLELLLDMAPRLRCRGPEDVPLSVLVPAYVLGELRAAFIIGLVLFLPFVVVDLVVAVVLTSAGLTQLSPPAVSLPFKILLFVLVDGWSLVVGSLVRSLVI